MPTSDLKQQAAAFSLHCLDVLISSDPAILKACFYSSSKMNDFSSVHCKLCERDINEMTLAFSTLRSASASPQKSTEMRVRQPDTSLHAL